MPKYNLLIVVYKNGRGRERITYEYWNNSNVPLSRCWRKKTMFVSVFIYLKKYY